MDSNLPVKILLADDDQDDCLFFEEALEELGLNVHFSTVEDGEKLMLALTHTPQLPDVLFLDLNMPRKNGWECLLEITKNQKLKSLQVIIYSTSFDPKTINNLYEIGAKYYIRKPADFNALKSIISKAITLTLDPNLPNVSIEKFVLGASGQ